MTQGVTRLSAEISQTNPFAFAPTSLMDQTLRARVIWSCT